MIINCKLCNKEIRIKPYLLNTKRYCSLNCRDKARSIFYKGENSPRWKGGKLSKICIVCNAQFQVFRCYAHRITHCSKKCFYKHRKGQSAWNKGKKLHYPVWNKNKKFLQISGENNHNWKGGKKSHSGYISILIPNHPFATKSRYVREHRLVAEKYLERFLEPNEHIHHINGIKNDNRPENLYVFTKQEHDNFHSLKQKPILKSNLL